MKTFNTTDINANEIIFELAQDFSYLSVQRGRSGIVIGRGRENRVYYGQNFSKVKAILETLRIKGRRALEELAKDDPELWEQWDDMSKLGFFVQLPEATKSFPITLIIDEETEFNKALAVQDMIEQILGRQLGLELFVRNVNDIVLRYLKLAEAQQHLQGPNEGVGTEKFNKTARPFDLSRERTDTLLIHTFMDGENGPNGDLAELLDRKEVVIQMTYLLENENDLGKRSRQWLAMLESEGFLIPFRVHLSPKAVIHQLGHLAILSKIEQLLQEAPNRPIDIFIERPISVSLDEFDAFYDALETFLINLYDIRADIVQTSYFNRYFAGILESSWHHNLICLKLGKHVDNLSLSLLSGHSKFTTLAIDNKNKLQDIINIIEKMNQKPCETCPFVFICPKSFNTAYFHYYFLDDKEVCEKIFRRECEIHKNLFKLIFRDMLDLCDHNSEQAIPLKLRITKSKSLSLSPFNAL